MELVINTFGTLLSRDSEGFLVERADGRQRVPATGITSILIGKGAQITSDAVMLAVEREIEILFVERSGNPVARVWSGKYGSVSTIRKGQLAFAASADAVEWEKMIIRKKIENQQAMLLMLTTEDEQTQKQLEKAIGRLEAYREKIKELKGELMSDVAATLRGWEGYSSRIYFEALNLLLPEEYRFEKRTQHPATDVTNAMLNYAYGMLYGKIESALIKVGIDPYIGVMHRDEYNRPVLVYDIIELYRMWVEYVVVTLLCQYAVTEEHYSVRPDGACWLEALGRRLVIQSMNDFLEEVTLYNDMQRSRITQIMLYAQDLAQRFKKYG